MVKRCTVLFLPVSVISYPRKMFKQLSNNLLNLVSIMQICCLLPTFIEVVAEAGYFSLQPICWSALHFMRLLGVALARTYWRANRESQDSSGDIMSLLYILMHNDRGFK